MKHKNPPPSINNNDVSSEFTIGEKMKKLINKGTIINRAYETVFRFIAVGSFLALNIAIPINTIANNAPKYFIKQLINIERSSALLSRSNSVI